MREMANDAMILSDAALRSMFRSYVDGFGDAPRHSKEAYQAAAEYKAFVTGAISGNYRLQEGLYERMMDCAVEFEESGFLAGARFALRLPPDVLASLSATAPATPVSPSEPESASPATPASVTRKGGLGTAPAPSPEVKSAPMSPAKDVEDGASPSLPNFRNGRYLYGAVPPEASISTKRIAELFETSNAKVVSRIEMMILPYLDAQSRRFFQMDIEYAPQNRRRKVYRMNKAACDLYLEAVDTHKKYVNIAGGIVKLRELMKHVFPTEADAS